MSHWFWVNGACWSFPEKIKNLTAVDSFGGVIQENNYEL